MQRLAQPSRFARAAPLARRPSAGTAITLVTVSAALLLNGAAFAFGLFERISWIDKAVHAFTAFAAVLALLCALRQRLDRRPALALATAVSFGLALGLAWEIGEWLLDSVYASDLVKGRQDTFLDLAMDGLGAALAGVASMAVDQTHR